MNKQKIIQTLLLQITEQYERAVSALANAHEAATGDDTKAESKYDTRGLEASYLAAGQASQADELREARALIEAFDFREFEMDEPIGPGALIEGELDDETVYFLLAPAGGGLVCETSDGESVTVLGPSSPLRQHLLGKRSGEILSEPPLMIFEVM